MPENNNIPQEEYYYEEPSNWSFARYFKSIAHFKWWVLGFSLAGALAGYLGFRLILNPMKKTATINYTYNLAGTNNEDGTVTFIDGTSFSIYDLTTKDTLEKVKASKEDYKNVNLGNNAIKATRVVNYYDADKKQPYTVYTLSSQANAFPSDQIAKDFLYDLANYPKTISANAVNNYKVTTYFTDNFDSMTFTKQVEQLAGQYNVNNNTYSSLAATFGGAVAGSADNVSIHDLQTKYQSRYYTSGALTFTGELNASLNYNKYVKYTPGHEDEVIQAIEQRCANYMQDIEDYNRTIAVYQGELDKITAITTDYRDDVAATIKDYSEKITEIKLSIDKLDNELNNHGYFLNKTTGEYEFDDTATDTTIYHLKHTDEAWAKGCKAFEAKINEYKAMLEADRDSATAVYKYCYSSYRNKVDIQNGGYTTITGNMSNILGAGIGLVAGFLITSLVTASIYIYHTLKKEEELEQAKQETK